LGAHLYPSRRATCQLIEIYGRAISRRRHSWAPAASCPLHLPTRDIHRPNPRVRSVPKAEINGATPNVGWLELAPAAYLLIKTGCFLCEASSCELEVYEIKIGDQSLAKKNFGFFVASGLQGPAVIGNGNFAFGSASAGIFQHIPALERTALALMLSASDCHVAC
jgi:hypothetical protein